MVTIRPESRINNNEYTQTGKKHSLLNLLKTVTTSLGRTLRRLPSLSAVVDVGSTSVVFLLLLLTTDTLERTHTYAAAVICRVWGEEFGEKFSGRTGAGKSFRRENAAKTCSSLFTAVTNFFFSSAILTKLGTLFSILLLDRTLLFASSCFFGFLSFRLLIFVAHGKKKKRNVVVVVLLQPLPGVCMFVRVRVCVCWYVY